MSLRRRGRSAAPLAALAVAVAGRDQRCGHLVAHRPAVAASGQWEVVHLSPSPLRSCRVSRDRDRRYRVAVRVAALYDVHGNAPALEAVLADVPYSGADLIVVGGDVVEGPLPVETLELLDAVEMPLVWVRGNCDRDPSEWVRERVGEERVAWLAGRYPRPSRSTSSAWARSASATGRPAAMRTSLRPSRRRHGSSRCWTASTRP